MIKFPKSLTFLLVILLGLIVFSDKAHAQSLSPCYKSFKPFKMAFIPDIHLSFNQQDSWILYNESLVLLQDTLKTLNKEPDLNLVIFGGNLIENKDHQLNDLAIFSDAVTDLNTPYYVIPGDRDVDVTGSLTKQDFCSEFRRNGFAEKDKTYWMEEPQENLLLIGLDTTIQNKSEGIIPPDELLWLDNILNTNKNKFTIILMHHPAFPACNQDLKNPWNTFTLQNSNDFLDIIKKYPQVKVVLSAHHHLNWTKNINNILFIQAPSIVAYPNQFKILTVYPDRVEVKNKSISYKQLVKKAKQSLINADYAREYNPKNPKDILKLQKGDQYSQKDIYYYFEPLEQ